MKYKKTKLILAIVFLGFLGLNWIAINHARSFVSFNASGKKIPKIEEMKLQDKIWYLLAGAQPVRPQNLGSPKDYKLQFETINFKTNDKTNLEAWWLPGEGNPMGTVLCFHGYVGVKSKQLTEAKEFHDWGFNVLLTDFRGSGGSDGHTTSIGYFEAVDVIAAYAWAIKKAPGLPVILYGQSMGSAAIMRALAGGHVASVANVLENPFDRLLSTVKNRFRLLGAPTTIFPELLLFWGGLLNGFPAFEHNPVEYAAQIKVPSLLLQGRNDFRVGQREATEIYDALAGPKKMIWVEDAAHEDLLARNPNLWRAEVSGFLKPLVGPNRR